MFSVYVFTEEVFPTTLKYFRLMNMAPQKQ